MSAYTKLQNFKLLMADYHTTSHLGEGGGGKRGNWRWEVEEGGKMRGEKGREGERG